MYTFHLLFRPEPEGGYTVLVPSLPGCLTWAESIEDGKELIKEAIHVYLESVEKHSEKIHDDTESFYTSVNYDHV
ncbi:type II toxin-antitoxin system HicB family antitoxin [Candidatus Peregrinibacteria bacterium]|nr:type II toxin-antitoxin system HicB family antitoxin [Candidatus Peregrinibacteria bacterium]